MATVTYLCIDDPFLPFLLSIVTYPVDCRIVAFRRSLDQKFWGMLSAAGTILFFPVAGKRPRFRRPWRIHHDSFLVGGSYCILQGNSSPLRHVVLMLW